jgi:murein DD-endopeptidase MepM/ murein hydrolase activator NlpD
MLQKIKLLLLLIIAVVLLLGNTDAEAKQRRKKRGSAQSRGNSDTRNVRAPKIKYNKNRKQNRRASKRSRFKANYNPPVRGDGNTFIPQRDLTIVNEDTSTLADGENFITEEAIEVRLDGADSNWVKIAEYYSVWSTQKKNPYGKDNFELKEPITFLLYDSAAGRYTSMPMKKTNQTSGFGWRWGRPHLGVDLDLETGDTLRAAFDGIVRLAYWDGSGYGNFVLIRHYNGLETLYGHMSELGCEVGQYVKAGDLIGWGGSTGRSTGPHLHYEVLYAGRAINPELVYDFSNWQLRNSEFTLVPKQYQTATANFRKVNYHRVQSGETLSSISRKYRVSVSYIASLNGFGRNTKIRAGQKIRIH